MNEFYDVVEVAAQELRSSMANRRVLMWILIAVLAAFTATRSYVNILKDVEAKAAEVLHAPKTERPGAMTDAIASGDSGGFLRRVLVPDERAANSLMGISHLALVFMWFVFVVMPLIAILLAAPAIASEVQSGSCRYALFRVPRSSWVMGKFVGQLILMAMVIAVTGLTTIITGVTGLHGIEWGKTLAEVGVFCVLGFAYGYAHIGMAILASQLARSSIVAIVVALVWTVMTRLLGLVISRGYMGDGAIADAIALLLPQSHKVGLWMNDFGSRAFTCTVLIAIGSSCVVLGYAFFKRRNL